MNVRWPGPKDPPTPHPIGGDLETQGTDDHQRRPRPTPGLLSLGAEPTPVADYVPSASRLPAEKHARSA